MEWLKEESKNFRRTVKIGVITQKLNAAAIAIATQHKMAGEFDVLEQGVVDAVRGMRVELERRLDEQARTFANQLEDAQAAKATCVQFIFRAISNWEF